MGHYVTNWKGDPSMAPQKQADGSYLFVRPVPPEEVYPMVVAERDTGAFVRALIDVPPGKQLHGVSEYMTWPEFTKLWGEIHGVKTAYKPIPLSEFLMDAPEPVKEEIRPSFQYASEYGFTGGDPEVLKPEDVGSMFVGLVTSDLTISSSMSRSL